MSDALYFNSRSADKKVGKGTNEHVKNEEDYEELSKIKDWRKVLSNFNENPFFYGGYCWKTVEHAFQAHKFKDLDKDLFESFTLNSGSDLANGTGLDAQKMRKAIKLNSKQIKEWNEISGELMKELWIAKFTQDELSRKVLLATNNAQLLHGVPRKPLERWISLETIRALIRNGDL